MEKSRYLADINGIKMSQMFKYSVLEVKSSVGTADQYSIKEVEKNSVQVDNNQIQGQPFGKVVAS